MKVAGEYHDGKGPIEDGTLGTPLASLSGSSYFSGGVIMNVIFALVVLPLVMFAGLPAEELILRHADPGDARLGSGCARGVAHRVDQR